MAVGGLLGAGVLGEDLALGVDVGCRDGQVVVGVEGGTEVGVEVVGEGPGAGLSRGYLLVKEQENYRGIPPYLERRFRRVSET